MSQLSYLIRRWRVPQSRPIPDYPPAPGTEIRYSPELVEQFKFDHQRLLALHGTLSSSYRRGDVSAIFPLLDEFEAVLTGHLLAERVRLYAYMDAYFIKDAKTREMLREYRVEMDRIGDSVMHLIREFRACGSDESSRQTYLDKLIKVGQTLKERTNREETVLYPLYMPVTTG